MLNVIVSLATGLTLFVIGCFVAPQFAPNHRSATASAIRISASCALALVAAMVLYVYLEG